MGIGSINGHEVNNLDLDHDRDQDRKFKDLEKRIDHGFKGARARELGRRN